MSEDDIERVEREGSEVARDEAPERVESEAPTGYVDATDAPMDAEGTPASDEEVAAEDADAADEVPPPKPDTRTDVKWTSVLLMTVILGLATWPYFPTGYDIWARGDASTWLQGSEDYSEMTSQMLGGSGAAANYVVPFELLGVLLVATLVGAIVIALRDGGEHRG